MSPVGGRLSNFVEGWKRITNDPYVLSIVAKGYRLRFTSPPLLRQIPWEIRSPQDPKEVLGMREQITIMLQKNAITEVPPDSPGFYSNVFLVRKASGGWRPVIDLKNLNAHIHAPHFRMFTTSSVLSSVEKGDYAFKIDLQDAYFHVPIHPSSRKYLRFAFENKVYQFRVLPFGLNTAPQVFTRLGHTVTAYLHRQGVSVIPYLDDWLVHHPDRQILLRHQALLIDTLDLVGFILNRKKSELDLTQDLQFLGIHLRLDIGRASLPESKAGEIVACARHLSSLKILDYSQVSHLMGSLNWASGLIPLGRLYLRPLQRHFHALGLTPTTSLCGTPVNSPLPSRSSVPAGPEVHLRRKVIPSARMEALMRHYKAAGFSDEVSRLAAAPRRPSTNRMYDDRWCRFARWAAGQGVDPLNPTAAQVASFLFDLFDTHGLSPQTVKGYRTCIGSVLNRTGKSRVVSHRAISDMIASMELQRPRATPVLPQWDLGVVLEALNKPPYEPLREASFKHLTLKTVFLLAMASAGRRSELHALRFDQNYIQFKPKGAGVTLYFSPEFMRKNQKPNQVNDPWYIPAIPTGKPEFGAPNCPVRALRYYHRYLTEHPELRKDRRRLFVPIKDNNAGKELSAPSISRWICTAIVDSHAAVQDSKNLSGSVKAHEVRAVATSLQLFNKADLHSVMKAGRWSSGGTFTSFYLRDLCPQAESLQRAGPIVAAGDIVKISTS